LKAVAIHLSDIHIRSDRDPVLSRAERISRAAHSVEPDAEAIFLLITGDVTFSGMEDQFRVAQTFIEAVIAQLRKDWPRLPIEVDLCPGNHDCDFTGSQSVRDVVLPKARLNDASLDSELLKVCCEPLAKYFQFEDRLRTDQATRSGIYATRQVVLGAHRFEIRSLNTAWASQKEEKQGQLIMPEKWLPDTGSSADVVFSLFHHPYNWLESSNAREFRKHVETYSDVVLTGHEHEIDGYTHTAFDGTNADYYEGGCLQGHDSADTTSFNVMVIDTVASRKRSHKMKWNGSMYIPTSTDPVWREFLRNEGRLRRAFAIEDDFYGDITSPGANFTHPRKTVLTILDLFVHPHLRRISDEPQSSLTASSILDGPDFWEVIRSSTKLVVFGDDVTGKTTLARHLYLRIHESGVIPLLVNADAFSHSDPDRVRRELKTAFRSQYDPDMFEQYRQLDRERRLLFLDNFREIAFNSKGISELLEVLHEFFGRIVIFASDIALIREFAFDPAGGAPLRDYEQYQLLEFGNQLREELIEKWLYIGREATVKRELLEQETIRTKNLVDAVLGKNLIPSYPLFILILMQQIEAYTSLTAASASEGYLYEVLITRSLQRSTGAVSIDTSYAYLANVANKMRELGRQHLTTAELLDLHEAYCTEYQLDLRFEAMEKAMVTADIMKKTDGRYCFRYSYFNFYFYARHLRDRLNSAEGRTKLKDLVDHVYLEENSNVLAFLTYLSRDPVVIEAILEKAKILYADKPAATLESDAAFFGTLFEEIPRRVFQDRPARETRIEINKALDRVKHNGDSAASKTVNAADEKEFNDVLQMNVAFKTLQILGQVIRNFPGSLPGIQKAAIARECYLLGLRTLSVFLELLVSNQDAIVEILSKKIYADSKEQNQPSEKRAEKAARRLLAWLIDLISTSTLRRISSAVGNETLRRTFETVRAGADTPAFDLIDISIKLDHFTHFPEEEIEALSKKSELNSLAMQVLRDLIVIHFYRFPRDFKTKQRCCGQVGLEYRAVARLEHTSRAAKK